MDNKPHETRSPAEYRGYRNVSTFAMTIWLALAAIYAGSTASIQSQFTEATGQKMENIFPTNDQNPWLTIVFLALAAGSGHAAIKLHAASKRKPEETPQETPQP